MFYHIGLAESTLINSDYQMWPYTTPVELQVSLANDSHVSQLYREGSGISSWHANYIASATTNQPIHRPIDQRTIAY